VRLHTDSKASTISPIANTWTSAADEELRRRDRQRRHGSRRASSAELRSDAANQGRHDGFPVSYFHCSALSRGWDRGFREDEDQVRGRDGPWWCSGRTSGIANSRATPPIRPRPDDSLNGAEFTVLARPETFPGLLIFWQPASTCPGHGACFFDQPPESFSRTATMRVGRQGALETGPRARRCANELAFSPRKLRTSTEVQSQPRRGSAHPFQSASTDEVMEIRRYSFRSLRWRPAGGSTTLRDFF